MRVIHIFNPETDYALAAGRTHYNPPQRIVELRRKMQLIPATFANPGDLILVEEDFSVADHPDSESIGLLKKKNISTVKLSELCDTIENIGVERVRISPWGWNHSLHDQLASSGVDSSLLKSKEEIDTLRELSHRRTTMPFQQMLQSLMPEMNVPRSKEFKSVAEALEFSKAQGKVFFKAPWSSSGRGVIKSDTVNEDKLSQWLSGFIKRQGSVMGEKAFDRSADFATEWICESGKSKFIGLSLFNTSPDGRYLNNVRYSQEEIFSHLSNASPFWSEKLIESQQIALDKLIATSYSGPVGIDMLIDKDGALHPCVELNLRYTMGMVALYS